MSRKDQTTVQGMAGKDQVVFARREDETLIADELDYQERHDRTIARLRLLWSQRAFLFRLTAWGLVLSTVITVLIPNRYVSTARLMPPDNASSSGLAMVAATLTGGGGRSGLSGIASDLLGLKSTSDIFAGILSSRTSEDALIEKFNLRKVYWDRRMEDARKDLEDHTDISVDRKTQIVTIKVTDHDPHRAQAMGDAYVDELNSLVATLSTSSARRERIFLEGRLQGVSQDLEAVEKEFSQFASKNTAINIPEQGRAMLGAVASLQGQLIATQSELEGLKQIYTDSNVRVRSLTAKVAELHHQLEDLAGEHNGGADAVGDEGESLYPSIRQLPVLGVTYADLYRRTRVQEAIFETLTQEYEMAKVEEAKEIPTVKVLDPADVPGKKSFPPRLLFISLGTILALSAGIMIVFGRARWESTDAADPGKLLAQEVFSTAKAGLARIVPSKNGASPGATNIETGPGTDETSSHN